MRTYREITEHYKHPALDSSGYVSDDSGWSDHMILDNLLNIRSNVFTKLAQTPEGIPSVNTQTLPCIELEEVSAVELDLPKNDCYVSKSLHPLPRTIYTESITTIDGNINFSYVEWTKLRFKKSSRNRATRDGKYYTIKDNGDGEYLYVLGDSFLKAISLTAVFENPYQAIIFPSCGKVDNNKLCNPWNTDFKTDRDNIDRIVKTAWGVLPLVRRGAEKDETNDSSEDSREK